MLQRERLIQWESDTVVLDQDGVSEAYFPLWGVADVEGYLAQSDRMRRAAAAEEKAKAEAAAAAEALAKEGEVELPAEVLTRASQAGVAAPEVPPVTTRVAWGAWFWVKRMVALLLVCLVGSVIVTMAMNPGLTFSDVIDLFVGKLSGL